jgi:hypothetical protein
MILVFCLNSYFQGRLFTPSFQQFTLQIRSCFVVRTQLKRLKKHVASWKYDTTEQNSSDPQSSRRKKTIFRLDEHHRSPITITVTAVLAKGAPGPLNPKAADRCQNQTNRFHQPGKKQSLRKKLGNLISSYLHRGRGRL